MPRGKRGDGYTQSTAAVEKLVYLGNSVEPGQQLSYDEIARYIGISIESNRDILTRARRSWKRDGVYFDNVRGYGIQKARPIDNKYDSSRQAIGVARKAKSTIQRLQSTDIVSLSKNDQVSVANHLGCWGFIGQAATAMAKQEAPRPRRSTTPDINPNFAIQLGYERK